MTIIVTVQIKTDVERAREVEREHADTYRAIIETARKHGLRSHRRLYGDGETLDIDEWESAEGRAAFLEDAAPYLRTMSEARGSGPPESKVWHLREERVERPGVTEKGGPE